MTVASFTVHEWKELAIGTGGVPHSVARRLHGLAERETRRLRVPQPVLSRTARPGLRAGQVVGVLTVPGASVEILPKVGGEQHEAGRHALTRMLAVAWDLPTVASDPALMATQSGDVLEILVRVFADNLLKAVRRGLPHRYQRREDDLPLLRGKLDVRRQITRHASQADRLACAFDELSVDTPLNRVLRAAVRRLVTVARTSANRRKLQEMTARFESVGDSADPLGEPVRLDRTNRAFHRLHAMAKLFLAADWQGTSAGRSEGFGLLFPMNELFEAFVGRSMQHALVRRDVRVQHRGRYALENCGAGLFALRPDIVVDDEIVIDTKWKRLNPSHPRLGVSESDVYQMLAYSQAYRARRLVLLYPWHEDLDQAGVCRSWRVFGTSTTFDIATVDVRKPEEVRCSLRKIVGGEGDRSPPAVARGLL